LQFAQQASQITKKLLGWSGRSMKEMVLDTAKAMTARKQAAV